MSTHQSPKVDRTSSEMSADTQSVSVPVEQIYQQKNVINSGVEEMKNGSTEPDNKNQEKTKENVNNEENFYNSVIIDNCIVSRLMGNGLRIRPISLEIKINPTFNINSLKKITYGSRLKDNKILQKLSDALEESKNKIITKLPVCSVIVANNYFWLHGRKPFKENKELSRELLRIRGAFFNN